MVFQIGMRPVGAPEHAVGKRLDDTPRERDHIAIGVLLAGKRTPAACIASSAASPTLRLTVATPRALPPECMSASIIARLSAPWQVACTITLRSKPRWSRRA